MDEESDVTMYQPTWQQFPLPFQSDEPQAVQQIHGIGDDALLDVDTDGDDPPPTVPPLIALAGPVQQTASGGGGGGF